jgi:hypothetical protein
MPPSLLILEGLWTPPSGPRLDVPFITLLVLCAFFNVLAAIYYRKARIYKEERDELKSRLHSLDHSTHSPANSKPTAIIRKTPSKGEG